MANKDNFFNTSNLPDDLEGNISMGFPQLQYSIEELKTSLKFVENNFKIRAENIRTRLFIWVILSFVFFLLILCAYWVLFHCEIDEYFFGWKVIYKMIVRGSAMLALFTALAFSVKMLRSYIYIYENVLHKISLVSSMPYLVASSINEPQKEKLYDKLIELVSKLGNTGLISKEDSIDINLLKNIAEQLKSIIK
jgi:hypothetical protein